VGEIEIIPKARICWPCANLFVLGTEIAFTLRPLYHNRNTDILVIPFRNLKFDLYGGTIINSCSFDYRKRVEEKIQQDTFKHGNIYITNCLGNENYKFFAFLRFAEGNAEHLAQGIEELFKILKMHPENTISRSKIVIPVCRELGDPGVILRKVIEGVDGLKGLKRVLLSTVNSECYINNLAAYANVCQELIDDCKVCL